MKGKNHELVNVILLPPTLLIVPEKYIIPFGVGYLFGTFFLSPDIDLSYSRVSKRWGPLRIIWLPFQFIFKHRGISHFPLIGTFLRVGYLALIGLSVFYILSGLDTDITIKKETLLEYGLIILTGIAVADFIHIVSDSITTLLKKLLY